MIYKREAKIDSRSTSYNIFVIERVNDKIMIKNFFKKLISHSFFGKNSLQMSDKEDQKRYPVEVALNEDNP